ncbi:cytochrome c3 family protein [Salidesulfovibrio brasiliensis]|uniref:cytochrome c3 family protein n=1 Tax=Salidesulfovibrio brasiliensis TaxID=221711 RepID=UPI0006D27218|nr:cytochrome c3 family protein [Salidesulfovibrio brasiliensis]
MEERKASKRCGGVLPFFIGFLLSCIIGWAVIPPLFYQEVEQPLRFSHQVHVEGQGMYCDSCHYFREDGSYAGFPSIQQCAECHYVDDPEYVMEAIVEQVGEDYEAVLDLPEEEMPEALVELVMSGEERDRKAELDYLVKFAIPGKEIPWLNYQYQPDNVFFSHAAHQNLVIADLKEMEIDLDGVTVSKIEEIEESDQNCDLCHLKGIATNDTPPPFERNIISGYSKMTMKMWQCERCHAQMGQVNACYVCHK